MILGIINRLTPPELPMIWNSINLQDPLSPTITALFQFHRRAIISISFVLLYVGSIALILCTYPPYTTTTPYDDHELETIWTTLPTFILVTLALPSLRLLYLLDEVADPLLTVKTTGHQWYWSYDYSDIPNLYFDSFMLPTNALNKGDLRLLEVDRRIVLPWNIETRLIITAADVIHSWTIPTLGVKADAIPGRLNQVTLYPLQPRVQYGQCSEICGANHSFMPIVLEVVNIETWANWAGIIINS